MPVIKSELSRLNSGLASKPAPALSSSENSQGRDYDDPASDRIANDDYPTFPSFWQAGAKAQSRTFKLAMATGTFIGLVIASGIYAGSIFFGGSEVAGSSIGLLVGLTISSATLALLAFVITRVSKLALLIDRVSEFEKSLNKSGRVAALTRELEVEATQIETRIEQYLATGTGLRQELGREAELIDQIFADKIASVRTVINDLDQARVTFLNEVTYINQAIDITRNFLTAKIGSLGHDFEATALSAAKILEDRLIDIAVKTKTIIAESKIDEDNLTRLISANEKMVEVVGEAPIAIERNIQFLNTRLQTLLEENIDRATAEVETLSDRISRSNHDLIRNLSNTPLDIEAHIVTLRNAIATTFADNGTQLSLQIQAALNEINNSHARLQAMIAETPQQLESNLNNIEPRIKAVFDKNVSAANERIERATTSLLNSNMSLNTILDETPRKLESYLARLAPTITNGFSENMLLVENRMSELIQKQSSANAALLSEATTIVERLSSEFGSLHPLVSGIVDDSVKKINFYLDDAAIKLQSRFAEFQHGIQKTNDEAVNEISGAISGQISQIRVLMEHVRGDLYKTVMSALEQQNVDIKDVETRFESITANIKTVISDVARSSNDFSGAISAQIQALDIASNDAVKNFGEALRATQDKTSSAISTDLGQAQKSFLKEYSLTEERLFRSLSNLNEVVQNCITSLEESINWRRTSFDEQIKETAEQNLSFVRSEVEQLVRRMQTKIDEINEPSPSQPSAQISDERTQDPDLMINLTRQMANISTILNDLKSGPKK